MDNDEKSYKFSNEFKNSFFLFFFCKSGEKIQFLKIFLAPPTVLK